MSIVQHSSRTDNWGTPDNVVQMVQQVLITIDLDPASSELHNKRIQAKRIFTADQNALSLPWKLDYPQSVFVNPPGGKINGKSCTKLFWERLIKLNHAGGLKEAIFVCFSVEALQTTQIQCSESISKHVLCVPARRIAFLDQTGNRSQPSHANAIVYVAGTVDNSDKFAAVFQELGDILRRY